jgi:hypothetical protein
MWQMLKQRQGPMSTFRQITKDKEGRSRAGLSDSLSVVLLARPSASSRWDLHSVNARRAAARSTLAARPWNTVDTSRQSVPGCGHQWIWDTLSFLLLYFF